MPRRLARIAWTLATFAAVAATLGAAIRWS
jgi:hypothetical protein